MYRIGSLLVTVLGMVLVLLGCWARQCGDAKVWHYVQMLPGSMPGEELVLPRVAANARGSYVFHVRDLPWDAYPSRVVLVTDKREGNAAEVHVEFRTKDGWLILSQDVEPGAHGGYQRDGRWWMEAPLEAFRSRGLRSYDVTVEVLRPSATEGDQIVLDAIVFIPEKL